MRMSASDLSLRFPEPPTPQSHVMAAITSRRGYSDPARELSLCSSSRYSKVPLESAASARVSCANLSTIRNVESIPTQPRRFHGLISTVLREAEDRMINLPYCRIRAVVRKWVHVFDNMLDEVPELVPLARPWEDDFYITESPWTWASRASFDSRKSRKCVRCQIDIKTSNKCDSTCQCAIRKDLEDSLFLKGPNQEPSKGFSIHALEDADDDEMHCIKCLLYVSPFQLAC